MSQKIPLLPLQWEALNADISTAKADGYLLRITKCRDDLFSVALIKAAGFGTIIYDAKTEIEVKRFCDGFYLGVANATGGAE